MDIRSSAKNGCTGAIGRREEVKRYQRPNVEKKSIVGLDSSEYYSNNSKLDHTEDISMIFQSYFMLGDTLGPIFILNQDKLIILYGVGQCRRYMINSSV